MGPSTQCLVCGSTILAELEGSDIADDSSVLASESSVISDTRREFLLNTNELPLDIECPSVQSTISRLRRRLSHHDKSISRLRAQLTQLEEERVSIATDLSRNMGIISPLRRMPPEIILEIFGWTLPSEQETVKHSTINATMQDSPWSLGRICSRWRTVALASQCLWSFIGIDCNVLVEPYPLAVLDMQLQRATSLRIHFAAPTSLQRVHPVDYRIALLKRLVECSPRWVEAGLILTPPLVPILVSLRDRIPQLRTLWLDSVDDSLNPPAEINCFQVAPALRSASILLGGRLFSVPLPSHQLTHYQALNTWERHLGVLRAATNLVEARIFVHISDHSPRAVGSSGPIEFRALRLLFISDAETLDFFTAPALEDLGLFRAAVSSISQVDLHCIDSLVRRSSCVLRRYSTYGVTPSVLKTMLQCKWAQAVARLTVVTDEADALVASLSDRDAAGTFTLVPNLQSLFVGTREKSDIDYQLCYDMLRSRRSAPERALEFASLAVSVTGPSPVLGRQFDELRKEGLNLQVTTGTEARELLEEWFLKVFPYRTDDL
ncbi:hypothetical protein B0H16DRAFT_1725520 [Mycena metata]|uniref:F-box domain-containing protein n=1 Tax=Mycena metata TaxID=1033252 RepID=A0AAD7IRW1_9AGAR|nr:hypothetical protein B0H16DRAFT_1725520 [Mycena metata]